MLDRLFSIDLRSLALFRICVASALLIDLAVRAGDLVAHYSDAGMLPIADAIEVFGLQARVSLHGLVSGSVAAEGLLFVLAALAALAMLLGWKTRVAVALSWLLLVSLQARNPDLSGMGGDKFLRIVIFWALFLPLGARFSLDALRQRRQGESPAPDRVLSVASAALLLQVALMYVSTGVHKNGVLWRNGDAVLYALHLDYWATPIGVWMREWPGLLQLATHGTRFFEMLGPALAFAPIRTQELRLATVVAFVGFHLSLAVALHIGPFPLFCIVAWTAFVPPLFWDTLERWRGVAATAVGTGGRTLGTPRWVQSLAAAALLYVLVYLSFDVGRAVMGVKREVPRPIALVGAVFRINQHWRMFAPNPAFMDTWPAVEGTLRNGRRVDPLRRAEPMLEKPEVLYREYPSFRWRLYLSTFSAEEPDHPSARRLRRSLAAYLCRDWNASHEQGERLESVRVWRVMEITKPGEVATVFKDPVFEGRCEELTRPPPPPRSAGLRSAAPPARSAGDRSSPPPARAAGRGNP